MTERRDLVIVGGGLAAGILALRLGAMADGPRVTILEARDEAFGEKMWSLQETDIAPGDDAWLSPAFAARWSGQSVHFQDLSRDLSTGYISMESRGLRAAVAGLPRVTVRTRAAVREIAPDFVTLEDGERIEASCVIDARGQAADPAMLLAYQKFVGWVVETAEPHGVGNPVIMDATVDQIDGFRFVYLLPFSDTRILIEDTRYANGEALDEAAIEATIRDYAAGRGWTIAEVVHREKGVLPITLAYSGARFWRDKGAVPRLGMSAGLFHSTTGYSLPDAVRAANLIAENWPLDSAALAARLRRHARGRALVQRFYRLLNRMLFHAAKPHERQLVMQKFYRLPQGTIERFYAGRTTPVDMMRILTGKPPIPIRRAVWCLPELSAKVRMR